MSGIIKVYFHLLGTNIHNETKNPYYIFSPDWIEVHSIGFISFIYVKECHSGFTVYIALAHNITHTPL